jgi:hypothetical protein
MGIEEDNGMEKGVIVTLQLTGDSRLYIPCFPQPGWVQPSVDVANVDFADSPGMGSHLLDLAFQRRSRSRLRPTLLALRGERCVREREKASTSRVTATPNGWHQLE